MLRSVDAEKLRQHMHAERLPHLRIRYAEVGPNVSEYPEQSERSNVTRVMAGSVRGTEQSERRESHRPKENPRRDPGVSRHISV